MLPELQKRKIIKLFTMYDAGNHGYLNFSDYEIIAHKLGDLKGWKSDEIEYQKLLNKYGYQWISMYGFIKEKLQQKLENRIYLSEWLKYHELVLQAPEHREEVKSLAKLVFDIVDLDESGNLDLNEWQNLFQIYNLPVVYASESFGKIDLNQDGVLSREELLSSLQEFYESNDPEFPGNYMFGPI
jgi:Ca2+-binding EF-hand superfamily protein